MTSKDSNSRSLSSFCQDRSSFKTKFALLSFYKINYSPWTESIILLVEYLQLISQVILASSTNYDHPALNSFVFDIIVYFFKLINPSYLLGYHKSDRVTETVLVILFCFTFLKLALFGYIILVSLWDYKIHGWLLLIWKWIFKLQTRVSYFLLTSFWVKAVYEAREGEFSLFGMSEAGLICIASLMLGIEFFFSFILKLQFDYVLPMQNFLSGKNNSLQVTTLFQKLIIQIFTMSFSSNPMTSAWVTSILGLVLSGIREFHFITKLPLYNYNALVLQRGLISIVTSVNLTYFLQTILKATHYEAANINFVVFCWIIISILAVKGGHEHLKVKVMDILCANVKSDPEILLHKVYFTEQIRLKEVQPGKKSTKYHWTHLVMSHQRIKIQDIFGVRLLENIEETTKDVPQEKLNQIYLLYFEELMMKHPKNFLINLHTAYTCLRSSEPYSRTIKVASQIRQGKWSLNYLSLSLLFYEIENSMLNNKENNNTKEEESRLNLYTYIQSKLIVDSIKKKMLKQTNLYLRVCANILGEVTNIEEIYSSGQKISKLKIAIRKRIFQTLTSLPEHYISPFLCYAKYCLVVNHSSDLFEKYCQSFSQEYFRFEKFFKQSDLVEENLYQDSNAFLLISTEKLDYGKILYCTSSLLPLCGGNNIKGYINSHANRLFPPSLRPYYDQLAKESGKTGHHELINKIHRTYLYHREKYVTEVDFCFKFHPYLAQGLCLDMIIRPIPLTTEYLLLKEDGTIEGASKGLSKILKLANIPDETMSSISVNLLSRELFKINAAFNMVQKHEGQSLKESVTFGRPMSNVLDSSGSPRNMSFEKASRIYSAFSTGNQKIQIYPYERDLAASDRNKNEAFVFYCHIKLVKYGNITLKVVSLRVATQDNSFQHSESLECENEKDRLRNLKHMIRLFSRDFRNPQKRLNPMKTFEHKQNDADESASENITMEDQENDNAQQVTHFTRQTSPNVPMTTIMFTHQTQPDMPLISPVSESRRLFIENLPTSFRRMETEHHQNRLATSPHIDLKERVRDDMNTLFSSSDIDIFEEKRDGQHNTQYTKEMIHKYKSSQHSSQKSGEKASDKAFKAAITTKSYPKSFIILCIFFYGVVLMTFLAQIIMKSASDTTMRDLQIKKNLLKLSQERSYKAALMHALALGAGLQIQGNLQAGGALINVTSVVNSLKLRISDMKTANDEMLNYVYSLDHEFQELLFAQDVQMNGTYLDSNDSCSKDVNTFQATQEFANSVMAVAALANPVSEEGANIFNYLTVNVANDYQFKNVEIRDIFIRSVDKQKESYKALINFCLTMTPFLLAGIGMLLIFIIWTQHRIEKKNMKAFIKINPIGVKDVSDQLIKFKKSLVNDESFENKWFSNMSEDFEALPEFEQNSTYSKKHNSQSIKYEEFRKRYFRYIFRVIIYISLLIAITIWDLISTKNAISVIYNRQGQLEYANYISNRVTTGYTAFNMLFFTNDTQPVEHQKPSAAVLTAIKEVQNIQTAIPSRFLEIDGTYNPEVKAIIFDNNPTCKGFVPDNKQHCFTLLGQGQPVSMIVANSAYQSNLISKYQDYKNSNKSTFNVLIADAYINLNIILPNFIVVSYEAQMITDIMNKSLDQKISENKDSRTTIMIIFSISLIIMSVLIWIDILRVIRNVYNDFKKVLQILPPNMILSSYLLKKFLRKTSNQLLVY